MRPVPFLLSLLLTGLMAAPVLAATEGEVSVSGFLWGTSVLFDLLTSNAAHAASRLQTLIGGLSGFPAQLAGVFHRLADTGFTPWRLMAGALPWLLLGLGAEMLFRRLAGQLRRESRDGVVARRIVTLLIDLFGLMLFVLLSGWPLLMSSQSDPASRLLIVTGITALVGIRAFALLIRIPLAPFTPEARIVALPDADARRLYRWVVAIAALAMLFLVTAALLADGGLEPDGVLIWMLLSRSVVTLLLVIACLRNRAAIATILSRDPAGRPRGAGWRNFAALWHLFAIFYIGLSWFSTSILLLMGRAGAERIAVASFAIVTSLVIVCLLIDDWAARNLARDHARRAAEAEAGAIGTWAEDELPSFAQFFGRIGQSAAILIAILLLIRLWSGPWDLIRNDRVATILPGIVQLAITLTLAYICWQLVVIGAERTLRRASEPRDGATPSSRDRVATLLPLVRNTLLATIAITATLIGLSSIGVDVVPLLAGAGVVGLAIGMGSQTLVRDVISGVFFLLDDAFRVGEYVNVGAAEGVIERAGIRSLQIRHYLGTLHTVPFGQIGTIGNRSRGWVVMQLEFRLPLTTDPSELSALMTEVSDALMADPHLGGLFLESPTFAGIVGIEGRVMVVRLDYKCRPGTQFGLRDAVYRAARERLVAAGYEFAVPELRLSALTEAAGRGGAA